MFIDDDDCRFLSAVGHPFIYWSAICTLMTQQTNFCFADTYTYVTFKQLVVCWSDTFVYTFMRFVKAGQAFFSYLEIRDYCMLPDIFYSCGPVFDSQDQFLIGTHECGFHWPGCVVDQWAYLTDLHTAFRTLHLLFERCTCFTNEFQYKQGGWEVIVPTKMRIIFFLIIWKS